MVAVVLGIVQVTLWAHANAVAQAAADHGAEVAAALDGTEAAGEEAAEAFIDSAGLVRDGDAVANRGTEQVTVVVTGSYPSVFGVLQVRASSQLVVERVGAP